MKKNIISFLLGNVSFYILNRYLHSKEHKDERDRRYCQLFDNWLVLQERADGIEEYFHARNIKEIAVYGYGNIGRHIVAQLSGTDITVKYVIDRSEGKDYPIDRYRLTDRLPEVEAIIVTPICEYKQIKDELRNRGTWKMISIEDVIYELL